MALGSELLTANPSLGDRVTMERLPHRLDRLVQWMEEISLDATVAFGAVNAAHLGSYARYYGGPAGIVVGRDRSRTLVVMYDEVPVAQELGDADLVLPYGERGFGLNLNPLPLLAGVVAGVGAVASAKRIGFSDELGGMADLLRSSNDAAQGDAGPTLHRIRMLKDEDELVKVLHSYELAWMAQAKVGELAQQPGVTEIELFSAALSTAQNANGAPIEWLCDMLSGPLTSKVCCPIHVASPRAVEDGDPVVTDIALGASGCSRSWHRRVPSWYPATPPRPSSTRSTAQFWSRSRAGSSPTTADTASRSRRSRTRTSSPPTTRRWRTGCCWPSSRASTSTAATVPA